jgi:predicted naringenin-chalcone synthase
MQNPKILSIGTSNPKEKFSQEEVYTLCGYRSAKIKSIFLNSDIDYRYFYIDRKKNKHPESLNTLYDRYLRGSLEISLRAVVDSLANIHFSPRDIDFIATVSCTGYLCPALSTRLIKALPLNTRIQQANILGMGCGGALPGLQRVFDHLKAYPRQAGLLVCVEICSATYYIDHSLETVVGNAICGDGAAALVLGNNSGIQGPQILDFETLIVPEHMDKVGFDYESGRLKIILKKEIPDLAAPYVRRVLQRILHRNHLNKKDIRYWIVHAGGRKVLDQFKEQLHFDEKCLKSSRFILKNFGNMSSPTVLFVLKEIWEKEKPKKNDLGIMIALGPGLSVEACLLKW